VGVHAVLYYNPQQFLYFLVFQGSFSNADFVQDAQWWRNWMYYQQKDFSVKRWIELGNSKSQLDPDIDSYSRRIKEFAYNEILKAGIWYEENMDLDRLETTTNISKSMLKWEGYYAIAKMIFLEVMNQYPSINQHNLIISGHSLGGSLAGLVSMWQFKFGKNFTTIQFSAPGVICLSKMWPKEIDSKKYYPFITNYLDEYDIIPMWELSPGSVCSYRTDNDGISNCSSSFGYGVSLFMDSKIKDRFKKCRFYTHSIYHVLKMLLDNSILFADGTTKYGCTYPTGIPICPSSYTGFF